MNHRLLIDSAAVKANIERVRGSKQVCLMVKANTYGLGNTALEMLVSLGYDRFGVSTIEEALKVRRYSKEAKILIVSYVDIADYQLCAENNFEITIYDFNGLAHVPSNLNYHLKIDTNMGRLGFQLDELEQLREELDNRSNLPVGIYSHLACASERDKTEQAIANFKYALDVFKDINFRDVHLLNSFGAANYDTEFDNVIRLGIGMWGYYANREEANLSRMKLTPALELKLTVSHVKQYEGDISYDHIDHVDGIVYTVPIGYHDGFYRSLTGYKIPGVGTIVGKVNMCQHMVLKNSQAKLLKKGERYKFFSGSELYDLCDYADKTTYEMLVALSSRIKREII